MKKQSILFQTSLLALCLFVLLASCQNSKKEHNARVQIYQRAMDYNDYASAANVLLQMLSSGANIETSQWQDSLAYVYIKMGNYAACEALCTELVEQDSFRTETMEMLALSQRNQNKLIEAAQTYQRLVPKSKNVHHCYILAQVQFELNRFSESLSTVQLAMQLSLRPDDWVEVYTSDNQLQRVPIEAALAQLKGQALEALNPFKNHQLAKEAYEQALAVSPDFWMVKQNLASLEQGVR